MQKWLLRNKIIIIGILIGGLGGYAYYHYVGCASGTCMISSKPVNSVLYFGLMGGVFSSMLGKKTKREAE